MVGPGRSELGASTCCQAEVKQLELAGQSAPDDGFLTGYSPSDGGLLPGRQGLPSSELAGLSSLRSARYQIARPDEETNPYRHTDIGVHRVRTDGNLGAGVFSLPASASASVSIATKGATDPSTGQSWPAWVMYGAESIGRFGDVSPTLRRTSSWAVEMPTPVGQPRLPLPPSTATVHTGPHKTAAYSTDGQTAPSDSCPGLATAHTHAQGHTQTHAYGHGHGHGYVRRMEPINGQGTHSVSDLLDWTVDIFFIRQNLV
ncbi:unnamed protein product [Protopolystoma xenopodis]|uniref:Uncharacterized protein n=1 Tax=Protopolystoma xenopodis TaxID=117903 RepID=A0A3S5BAP0_9PLAT|nr:unnamed protein product [Protopolystoma xenopodis]